MKATNTETPTSSPTTKREQRMAEARAVLEQGLDDISDDPRSLAAYLRFRAHFRSYGVQNTIMIRQQRPSARYVKGYKQWQKHGRQVRKGERGITIWIPLLRKPTDDDIADGADPERNVLYGWRVGYVFDIAQTETVADDALEYVSPIPQLEGDEYAYMYDNLKKVAAEIGYEVIVDAHTTTEGYCSHRQSVIGIRAELTVHSKAVTLAH